jgi:hypothetical protein
MKDKNKNIIIVVTCIATALICIVLTFWGNWKNDGVLTTDAFMAVLATFIGICATLIVGVQIVSFIELKEVRTRMKAVQEERRLLKEQQEQFSKEMSNIRVILGNALALSAVTARNKTIAFESYLSSIVVEDWSSGEGNILLYRYQKLSEIAKTVIPKDDTNLKKRAYNNLSFFNVPTNIEHYNEIMALHHQLLLDLSSNNQPTE